MGLLCITQGEQAYRCGRYCKVDWSCVMVAPLPDASGGHVHDVVGWTLQLPGLVKLQGGLGAVRWRGTCVRPPHFPLMVAGTVYCPSFGCMWKDLAPSSALMVLGTAQPSQPSWVLSAQILGSQGFSIIEAFGGVLSHLHWAAVSACCRRPPLGQQPVLLPTLRVCTFRCSHVFVAFFTRGCGTHRTSEYFSWNCFFLLTLFSMARCPCCVFDLYLSVWAEVGPYQNPIRTSLS